MYERVAAWSDKYKANHPRLDHIGVTVAAEQVGTPGPHRLRRS